MLFQKVTLVGVGLLGGSLGLALRQRRLAGSVVGFVRRAASVGECTATGAVDVATENLADAVGGADLVVLCTPITQMRELTGQFLPYLKAGTLVTDVGSVKQSVVDDLESLVAKAGGHYVGSHPMAGAEKTGVAAARGDLFNQAICVVTPTRKSKKGAVKKIESLWHAVGGCPLRLTPAAHDIFVSRSSHLPHLVAAGLAHYVLDPAHAAAQARLCASGFRDTTRVAAGSPEMWRDIALANRVNLSQVLGDFIGDLQALRRALKSGDEKEIERFLVTAKKRRDSWRGPGTSPE